MEGRGCFPGIYVFSFIVALFLSFNHAGGNNGAMSINQYNSSKHGLFSHVLYILCKCVIAFISSDGFICCLLHTINLGQCPVLNYITMTDYLHYYLREDARFQDLSGLAILISLRVLG